MLRGEGIDACLVKPVRHTRLMNTFATVWAKEATRRRGRRGARRAGALGPRRAGAARGRVLVVEDNLINQKVA